MADSAKVIQLQPEVQRHVRARLSRLSKPAQAVHEKSKKLVAASFIKFFDAVDDAMFQLADDAVNNEDQNLYFDSMREIRVQRQAIEKRYQDALDEAFARLVAADQRDQLANAGELTADALSLIKNDDLEQLVAFEAATKRAAEHFAGPLTTLVSTLNTLVPMTVTSENVPVGPQVLNLAIMSEIKRLDIGIKAKLVVFDVFEKVVISAVGAFCKYLSSVLEGLGVPLVSSEPQRSAAHQAKPSLEKKADREALIELLNFIQKLPVSGEPDQDVMHLLDEVQKRRGIQLRISRVEQETIKLVGMLFDFVLRDAALAVSIRELICRLKVPVLKVALLDPTFLESKRHPARFLLNDMACSAIGWQPQQTDTGAECLLQTLSSIVNRIVRDFDRDTDIFKAMLVEFRAFREKEHKKALAAERRIVHAEDTKAQADVARKTVRAELDARTSHHKVPSIVSELLFGPWANVLFVIGLKRGFASIEWADGLKVVNDLIASVQPIADRSEKQKRMALAPDVVRRLRRGLDSISFNPFEVSEQIRALEDLHMALIRGDMGLSLQSAEMSHPATAPDLDTTLGKRQQASAHEAGFHLEKDDPLMIAVAGFMPGAWFDLKEGSDGVRCRLAAIIKATGKYIFVNRNGAKVAEHTQLDLALKFKNGEVKPVDNGSLFDRALENVVSNLREAKNKNKLDMDHSSEN